VLTSVLDIKTNFPAMYMQRKAPETFCRCKSSRNKKAQLSIGKTRYSLCNSCCSNDLQGHPRLL